MKRSASHRLRRLSLALALIVLFLTVTGGLAYWSLFSGRVETPAEYRLTPDDFPGLRAKAVSFPNGDGISLTGQLYARSETDPLGLVVVAHGMGLGHRAWLNVIDRLARHGYLVFAYDATGYDASEGSSTRGFPQAVLDLDSALRAAEALPETQGLPVCLFGHSMGAHAVCAALPRHPEVRAVAAVSGFDSTAALIQARLGLPGLALLPGALLWERLRFGEAAGRSALAGFAASEARVLIVHSKDDDTVPIACGLERYRQVYGSDPRFTFLPLEQGGHGLRFAGEVEAACLALFDEVCKAPR